MMAVVHIKILHLFCLLLTFQTVLSKSQIGTVYWSKGEAVFKSGVLDKTSSVTYGTYKDSLSSTGWNILEVKAGHGVSYSDDIIMYTAGYLEGALSAEHIYDHYINMYNFFIGNNKTIENGLRNFFKEQYMWSARMVKQYAESDPYWQHVGYILYHFNGLVDGYNDNAKKTLERFAFSLLNGVGDVLDLRHALFRESRPDWFKMTKSQAELYVASHGHCSALVKVMGAYENVYMAHSSWFSYTSTLRIYKHYDFNVANPHTAAKKISFSSYPGFLESLDDFYILSSDIVMLQTTNNVFNNTLYDLVLPSSLFAWQRVRVANMMAHSGREWADILAKYNSGTYNNQYMVIDMKLIELKKDIHDNALWVIEQIPGLVKSADQTSILRAGYWPSYNVPFFKEIYDRSGYPQFVQTHGTDFSYQLAPRAKIFRRDQDKVVSLETMKNIMRYNDYLHDPYSDMKPCNTICCRGDLRKENPTPMGCYDSKVTDFHMAQNFTAVAISGPTLGTGLAPFSWAPHFLNSSHLGLPMVYNFDWVKTKPSLP